MAKIKYLRENNIQGTASNEIVYPVTIGDAIYINGVKLTDILNSFNERITALEKGDVLDVSVSNSLLNLIGDLLEVNNNILTIPYSSVSIDNNKIIF